MTYSAVRARIICALPPLMIKLGILSLAFGYYKFTLRLSQFKIPTNFMYDNATFSTL